MGAIDSRIPKTSSRKTPASRRTRRNRPLRTIRRRRLPARVFSAVPSVRRVNAPLTSGTVSRGVLSAPQLRRWRFRHQEIVPSLTSTGTAFNVAHSSYLHPAEPTFLWLRQIAPLWEKFQFHSVTYEIRSKVPATTAGSGCLYFDTDPEDPVPTSLVEMMNNAHCISGNIYIPQLLLSIPGSRGTDGELDFGRLRYCDDRGTDGQASRLNSAGRFHVAFDGVAAGAVCDLYITYDIEFVTPQYSSSSSVADYTAINPDATHPFGNTHQDTPIPIRSAIADISGGRITLPPRTRVTAILDAVGTVLGDTNPTITFSDSNVISATPWWSGLKHNAAGTSASYSVDMLNQSAGPQWASFDFTPSCTTLTGCSAVFGKVVNYGTLSSLSDEIIDNAW